MVNSIWGVLGSKLLSAGASYLQQVRLVQELRALAPEAARARLQQFVAGLTPTEHAGFRLTLGALLSKEQTAEGKRFVQSLIDGLGLRVRGSEPVGASVLPQVALAAEPISVVSEPAVPDAEALLLREAERIDAWLELDDARREVAVEQHLARLDAEALDHYSGQVTEIGRRMGGVIERHKADEARLAAGRWIEDQQSYLLGRLAGRPPDPDWTRQLQVYERVERFASTLAKVARQGAQARRQPLKATEPTASQGQGSPVPLSTSLELSTIRALQDELTRELAAGRVAPERESMLRRLIEKLEELIAASQSGALAPTMAFVRMQALMQEFMPYVASPGRVMSEATPHGRELLRIAGSLKTLVMQKMATFPQGQSAAAYGELAGDLTKVLGEAAKERDDMRLLALESSLLRPAAHRLHEVLLAPHAMLAQPLWACHDAHRHTNTLLLSTSQDDLRELVGAVAAAKGLEVESTARLQNHGQQRWDALRTCHVALFDLRGVGHLAQLAAQAPRRARELGGSAYEIGLAFALGKPVLILVGPEDQLPFDIDLVPLRLFGEASDADRLSRALDETFYVPQRIVERSGLDASLAQLRELVQGHPQQRGLEGLGLLADELVADPVGFAAAADLVLDRIGGTPRWQLLRPAWPPVYPAQQGRRRCFHVMAFGETWSDAVRDAARAACADLGYTYRRGDEAEDGRIIHAIWEDLTSADVVLVDLTGLNLNVLIELGMAHTIGRPVLLVQCADTRDLRPYHIEKLRVQRYGSEGDLGAWLRKQLGSA